jgi:hypothetical protein
VVFIIAQLIKYIQQQENAGSNADGKPQYIDKAVNFVS